MATRIRTLNFLPEVFQTKTNAQFLAATLDQIVAQPATKKIEGYVGSKVGYGINAKDYYVLEPTKIRTDYQLDPGIVFKKNNENTAKDFISYPGILDAIKLQGGIVNNNDRLFNSEFYSWDSFVDLDKIINFNQYYWIPEGPESVVVTNDTVFSSNNYRVISNPNGYVIVPTASETNAGSTNPTLTLLRGGTYTFEVNQDSDFWIQGEPGVTGFSASQPNLQTRDVYGVDNNGANQGIVTFNVPPKNAQDEYNFPGNNLVDVISTLTFSQLNGALVSSLTNGLDGVTSLNGLTVLFYNTLIPAEVGYISNFYDYTPYGENNDLTPLDTISITGTIAPNIITCSSTANLTVGNAIIFNGVPIGGINPYSTSDPNTIYFVKQILNSTEFTISLEPGGNPVTLTTDSGAMTAIINQGLYEQGFYTNINENFYKINYIGDPNNPIIRLTEHAPISINQKITAVYGTQYISRNFYRNTLGFINIIPYLSAPLDTLYYQDGTSSNKVGIIKLIESNFTNILNVTEDILGKKQYTSTNGVVFTNGLKVRFQGLVIPTNYLEGEYYVEGVGTAIQLLPTIDFVAPEIFTENTYIPWDIAEWDTTAWDGNSYIPIILDYITIARNAIDKNAWSRSNRWFHIDVINATATYNNNPSLATEYTILSNKAKRPIIEFYPNLKLFNSGVVGKNPVDFIDVRTTDAFSLVAGKQNYYPDMEVYTNYSGTIASTNYLPTREIISGSDTTGIFVCNTGFNTTGFRVNDQIIFDNVTIGTGFFNNVKYYIAEIVSATQFKLSASKNGEVKIPLNPIGGPYAFVWSPQGTTVSIDKDDILAGTFQIGQYITDSKNILPRNSRIVGITGTTTLTLTLSWDDSSSYFNANTDISYVAGEETVENYGLFDGARVIFSVDDDPNVRNKIYVSRFTSIAGGTPIITLTEAPDAQINVNDQTVALRGYYNFGKENYYDGINWIRGQQKTDLNQPPLFDIFDKNSISFGDDSVYTGTSFEGCKLFAYGIGAGLDDSVLGFPIRYSAIDNVGDINFDVSINKDTFNYVNGTNPVTQKVNTGYVYQYSNRTDYVRQLGWQTAVSPSIQYQVFSFNYDPLVSINSLYCDIEKVADSTTNWPTIKVFQNNIILAKSDYTVTVGPNSTIVNLNINPIIETVFQVLILSNQTSQIAYYQIPINLNNNPLNQDLTTVNVGDIRGQYQSIFFNSPNTTGMVFGSNNYRDLGNLVPYGDKIIQNSAALVLPGAFLRNAEHNLFDALMFNSKEYVKYKNLLMYTIQNNDYPQRYIPSQMLDDAIDQITAPKNEQQPFFWSDMLPNKSAYAINTYNFANSLDVSIYPLTRIYDFTESNYYGVLVYLKRTEDNVTKTIQLVVNIDYTVSTESPSLTITKDLIPGDVVTIKEYYQTYGSYVPNTPTKLGLYPSYVPQVILDSNYNVPTYFIRGHDGSYNRLYGNYDPIFQTLDDFRDQVLLEFELRIYNNLKINAQIPIQVNEILPGFFRETKYSSDEWLRMYSPKFLNWVGQNRLNYKLQFYNSSNSFSYNYSRSANALNKAVITQGFWRGVYQYYFDTTTPHITPWEMLGFVSMPDWWTSRYGPAPYTSDNLVLWTDIQEGLIWNNGDSFINPLYARPGLLSILPVNSAGELLSPLDSLVGNYNEKLFQRDWKVGDDGPVELSYRRSSSFPFDLIQLYALMHPAKFYNLAVAIDKYKFNEEFNQYLINDRKHLTLDEITLYGNGTPSTSYINWIVDYEKQLGINATENIQEMLNNLDVRLVYRLAGFSDKKLLKFYVEKGSPNSNNASLLIPDESYSVLLYENQPFDRIIYSGVIVQRSENGYTIFGNSQTYAYFKTFKPKFSGNFQNITVEDITVKITTDHYPIEQNIPYNTTFFTIQETAQFLADYGAYLEASGMKFEDTENDITINWSQMIAELIYWAQTGWSTGTIVTLNPSAQKLTIDKESSIVQPLTLQQQNFALNQNLYPIQIKDLFIDRQNTAFNIIALNEGDTVAFGQFNLGNFEHGIVFDNVTLFGDVIYNLISGLRQNRILVKGTKSADWNGTVDAAGFIYNQDNIKEWNKNLVYTKGEIVTYKNKYWISTKIIQPSEIFKEEDWKITEYDEIQKGLLPNASTRSFESTLYYDINQGNLENDADLLSFSLIGYRPRDYMALVDLTDITQVNVYKNMIKEKGTLNSASAFRGAQLPQGGIDYEIYENWAILAGEFGGILNNNFIEFRINQKYLTGNPSIVGLTNGVHEIGVQQQVPIYSLFNYGRPVDSVNVLATTSGINLDSVFPDAGYVNYNDIKMSAFYYAQLPFAANKNGVIIPIQNFYVRDYVWLANYLENWEVFTPVSMGQVIGIFNNLNETVTIIFNQAHNLSQYEPFAIVNFDPAIDGYYLASVVIDAYRVLITLTLDTSIKEIVGQGIALKFQSQRVATPAEIESLPLIDAEFRKNTVWVDTDVNGSWAVYQKNLNYKLQNQITKSVSQSLGSAVAIGDDIGYLIGDADDGKVYRYIYNPLAKEFQLYQTITGNTGFGSVIAHSGDIFAIVQPTGTGRSVKLYQLQNTLLSQSLVLIQTIPNVTGATTWGSSIAISGDQTWMYISDIDNNKVHVYLRSSYNTGAGYFTIGDTYTILEVGTTDFTTLGATSNDIGITFIATGVGSGTGIATNVGYTNVSLLDGYTLGLTTNPPTGEKFGYKIATDYEGDCIVISAPFKDYLNVENWGYAYAFNRIEQNYEISSTPTPLIIDLGFNPPNIVGLVSATNGATDQITINILLDPVEDINKKVLFTVGIGSGLAGTNINSDQVYYIESITGYNITIKSTRDSAIIALGTEPSISNVKIIVQTSPLNVYRNGSLVAENEFIAGMIASQPVLFYTGQKAIGDIIKISGFDIVLTQTFLINEPPISSAQFGLGLDINRHGSEILIGAPYFLNSQIQEGIVYRYTDAGAKFGVITGTFACNVTTNRTIYINGYLVSLTAGNAEHVANLINISSIPNVTASNIDSRLIISLIDQTIAPINQKLFLSFDSTVTVQELGLETYLLTQEILCPHTGGATQFGSVVKFNEFDSALISAPVGTRYSGVTFDFTDDENQDNDTIFDNNATQFVDQSPNFGAVYMYDFVNEYNANKDNPGNFVYAQSVNSPNLVYTPFNTYNQDTDITSSNQPRYGTAIDFNGYNVIIGTPNDTGATTGNTYAGSATIYNNAIRVKNWAVYRYSSPIVDINKINNAQIFSAEENTTLINLDYIDPLQGKILGVARENIDYITNTDPATYNNTLTVANGLVWGSAHIGKIWLNTTNLRFVNYHQNGDVSYNAQYWGTLFPGSDVAVYSWISSNVPPDVYDGPGIPFDETLFSIQYVINPAGALTPVYFFWARDTNNIFVNNNKTLADSIIASYISSPKSSGISYFSPLLPSAFSLYNCEAYINANDSVLHIGFATGTNNQIAHTEYNLIRDGNPDDFLPGFPLFTTLEPYSLYNKLLDSISGVDETGNVIPDPYLPKSVQSGVLVRPRQSLFYNRFVGLKNYLQYANNVLKQYPIVEIRQTPFLTSSGVFYNTADYWEFVNWWAPGFDDNTKSSMQVNLYADLSTLSMPIGTIVTVATNVNGVQETYIYNGVAGWERIGLKNGTIQFKSSLWDYESVRLGFGDNFFDTDLYDIYPSEETRKIVRALNEEIYNNELLIHRNKSLILLFDYIQSEASQNQNYLPWLNKTSFIDVSHTIRELRPLEVFQTDNQDFLSGYMNEVKPYHVVIKEFVFKYKGSENYAGNITDFDLPAKYDSNIKKFVTPQLVYQSPNAPYQFLPNDPIWENPDYVEWKQNFGISLTGENEVLLTTLASYIPLTTNSFSVNNASGFPINGILLIDTELIGYSTVDRALNVVSGLTRGVNGTNISPHLPGAEIFADLPPVLLLNGGRAYTEPPKVVAYIDTTIYPEPIRPAQLEAVMGLDSVIRIDTIDPGEGYAVLPTIIIDPAFTITFSSSDTSTVSSTVQLFAPLLQTGDLIFYNVGTDTTPIGGLQKNQWYYINVLETVPSVVIGFYTTYFDAINDHDRIQFLNNGTGTNHSISIGARASAITTSYPIRENNITLRFDRTTYNSDLLEWRTGAFYGSFFAGELNNRESVSSSSITLQDTQPPISSILASAQGVSFEITNFTNDRIINYSSFLRYVLSTETTDNSVRLILQDDGSGNPNASGGTNGFYIGMPIKFTGAVGTSGIVDNQVYYVNSILNQTDFTLSLNSSGTPVVALADWTVVAPGLTCYVGEISDTAVVTINYPGIRQITATAATTNKITIPINPSGTGGTQGFYIGIPIFFTGTANTLPQNGVFGGIVENDVYYVTTIVDNQTFTMSKTTDSPQLFDVTATNAGTNTVEIDADKADTSRLDIGEPVIFNTMVIAGVSVTNFGGLISGEVYYIASIVNSTTFTVSATLGGVAVTLSTIASATNTSALMTTQKDVYELVSETADTMVVNVNLPVSPGQINGQRLGFYETSGYYPNLTGDDVSLINRNIVAMIGEKIISATELIEDEEYTIDYVGTTDWESLGAVAPVTVGQVFTAIRNGGSGDGDGLAVYNVSRVVLSNYESYVTTIKLELDNLYVNMPLEVSTTLGSTFLAAGTTYYIVDMDIIEITVSQALAVDIPTSETNVLKCTTTASLYINMPITFSGTGLGGVDIDTEYYVKEIVNNQLFRISQLPNGSVITLFTETGGMIGTGSPFVQVSTSVGGTIVNPGDTEQLATISIASPAIITVASAPATNKTVVFKTSGSLPTGIDTNVTYYVNNLSPTTFNISLVPGGSLVNTSGSQSGTHTMVVTSEVDMYQTPLSVPIFDVSYILGGYRVIIENAASGYAVSNQIKILGTDMGGQTPLNDLLLFVNEIDTNGEILSVIRSGNPPGETNYYYVKVISPHELQLYNDALLTVPASGLNSPYVGTPISSITAINSSSEKLTVSDISLFELNDAVVFTGDLSIASSALTIGISYYITSIVGSDITVSIEPDGANVNLTATGATDFTIAKLGSFAFLPEPFIFNQSIVKFNNRVYICVISNNDDEFIFGKWELLTSDDRRLNAMDRVNGYYDPTVNMPGRDLSQLFEGVIYPNSIYLGNYFKPNLQYPLDTVLRDKDFYPTAVDVTSVIWNGSKYFATANMPDYSSIIGSDNGENWSINRLTNTDIDCTDIIFAGGYYIATSTNSATPIFRSQDGINWTTNGYFTPWGGPPWDTTNYDMTALSVSSLFLNSVGYANNLFVAVGYNIVTSSDTYVWRERLQLINTLLSNQLYSVDFINVSGFEGFIAVGKGQEFDYSTGITTIKNINLVYTSTTGIDWTRITPVSGLGFYGVSDNGSSIVAVGEDGIIYNTTNGVNWLGVNENLVLNALSVFDYVTVTSTQGLTLNQEVKFSSSFNIFVVNTSYYVKSIVSGTQITLSATPGGPTLTLTIENPIVETYLFAPRTPSLRDIHYSNGIFMAVGDLGLIKTSIDGITWTTETSGTVENLNGVMFNNDDNIWIVVGDNNTIIVSADNGVTWTGSALFPQGTTIYDVRGDEFTFGYGPEELVPGVVTDNLMLTVATRPGTNWDETIYQHVGYNVVSLELEPTSSTQTVYSWDVGNLFNIQSPAKVDVYLIDGVTGLGTHIYPPDYTINWVYNLITLANPLNFIPIKDKLLIQIYETGNGNQLVKASTKTDPIRMHGNTGWNEILVNCNYSGEIYQGSGVIRPETFPVDVVATNTDGTNNSILCDNVDVFLLNGPIQFQGNVFGGIIEDTIYYVKTISYITNRITISDTLNITTGAAGPTKSLANGTGTMNVIIKIGYGEVWTDPEVYHNGNELLLGTTNTITRTKAATNTITTNTTTGMAIGQPIVFSNTMFGTVIVPQTTYYIAGIADANEFRISINSSATVAASLTIGINYSISVLGNTDWNAVIGTSNTPAVNIVAGESYVITFVGGTDFTTVGAGSNTIGVSFIATGSGVGLTGTGTVDINYQVNDYFVCANVGSGTGEAYEVLTLTNATGGAEFITNDFVFGIAPNGISASIIFARGDYNPLVDYISYTLLGQTLPVQYGYTLPETEFLIGDGTSGPYSLQNYLGGTNPENAIVEVNGVRLLDSEYSISFATEEITFTSTIALNDVIAVTTFNSTDRQYFNTQFNITGNTVSKITYIDNNILPYAAISIITATVAATDAITCSSVTGMFVGQTIVFKSDNPFGNIQVDGTVYYIVQISGSTIQISTTFGGSPLALTDDTPSSIAIAYAGGLPAVRVTTNSAHNLTTNDIVRLDGILGSTQLNNNTYYVHVISSNQFDLYSETYDPDINAINYPIIEVSAYISGGFAWIYDSFTLITTTVTATTTSSLLGDYLTVADTSMLVIGTPIIFTGSALGGLTLNTTYYVRTILSSTTFSISETRDGSIVALTNDAGTMSLTQWEQDNVDRLYVTVNGLKVPSSSLRLNPNNQVSILIEITSTDSVIILSMIPSATPNEEVFLLNVNAISDTAVYRANTQTRTWLTQSLYNTDDTIYVFDVSRITDIYLQESTTPSLTGSYYVVGINVDKRIISEIRLFNNTTGQSIASTNYEYFVEAIAPAIKIAQGPYISVGDSLTISVVLGNLIYINGEQIKFTVVDFINNTISGLQRGANGTGEQEFIPENSEVFGIISNNQLPIADYTKTWNSNTYNIVEGDPLQISTTESAIFLRGDIN